jgi:hypothetical protein
LSWQTIGVAQQHYWAKGYAVAFAREGQ